MKRLLSLLDESPLILGFLIAFWGGVVRGMRCKRKDFTWWGFFYRVLAAGFVGVLAGLVMSYTQHPPKIEAAFIGACGYAAIDLLDYLPKIMKEKIKNRIEKL